MATKTSSVKTTTKATTKPGSSAAKRVVGERPKRDAAPSQSGDAAKSNASRSTGQNNMATENNTTSTVASGATAGSIPPQQRADLDIEYYRGLLLGERARLEAERDQIRNRGLDMDGALPEEGEGGEEDTADLASAMMDKEFDLSVEDEIEEMLLAVDHALKKMEDGTYGICDISGQNIPLGRLELIPWASLTVECQALSEGE
jgi:DnaK suppressor protein